MTPSGLPPLTMADSKKVYRVREVEFLGKRRHIVLHNAGEWCPLLEVSNILLLRDGLPRGMKYIEKHKLEDLVNTCLLRKLQSKVKTRKSAELEEGLAKLQATIPLLSKILSIYPKFTSTDAFDDTMEKHLYNCLGITIYHGWLTNPQDTDTSAASSIESYVKLILELEKLKKSESKGKTDRLSLLESILKNQFTSYGFARLCNDVPEGVLCLLYRDSKINVLYKNQGMLHVLVTRQDVLENYPDALWRKLEKFDEDGDLLTSSFDPINVTWCENERNLIEDEKKAVKQKEARRLRKAKKRGGGKDKKNTVKQDESGEANKDLDDETEANTAEDRGPASPKEGVLDPSQDNILRDEFMKFLKGYLVDGKPYFRDQVELMHWKDTSCLIICYDWIKKYDKELAVSICSNYLTAAEDLRLCFCDYFHSIIQEMSVETDKAKLYTKIKLTICCLPLHKRFMSFEEFAAENCMYTVYELEGRFVNSTSYVGRLMALGYLNCILKIHKSGYSWDGQFGKSHMSVKIVKGFMTFKIKRIATMVKLNKDNGIADFVKYKETLFPLFKKHDVERYPPYFDQFVKDYSAMPDPIESPVEFEIFQKYMAAHLFAKAPLVRSGLVTNTYQVCESLVIKRPLPGHWPIYPPLDCKDDDFPVWDITLMSSAMNGIYTYKDKSPDSNSTVNRFDKNTYWCALMLGRHGLQHLHWHTKKGNVQTLEDLVIANLTIGHDLNGAIAKVVHQILKINNFDGPFSSVWRTFVASETFDEPGGDAAVEAGETETGGSGPPLKLTCKVNGKVVDLSCNDLSCLEDTRDVFDSVIDFVYARISLAFANEKDILLVRPNHAYLMGNLSEKADLEHHAKSLDLNLRRMVLVPVNDNTDYMRAEGGTHWSLLVIQIAEDWSTCRFVHHDSLSGGLNHTSAIKYSNAFRQVLPEAPPVMEANTPRQLNGSDCGLCVLALSKAICTWWSKRGRSGKSNCWVDEINSSITGQTFADMRGKLRQNLMEEMQALSHAIATAAVFDFATDTATAPDLATAKSAVDFATTTSTAPDLVTAKLADPAAPLNLKCKVQGRLVELLSKDLSCLEDGRFLVDSIIDFVFARISLAFDRKEDLLLMPPKHAFLMSVDKKIETKVEAKAKSPDLNTCRMVLVPVDGNMDSMHADRGRHWSLLVIHISESLSSVFVHYDSLDGANHDTAVKYADAFWRVLPDAPPVREVLTPGQVNASDSGLCVLAQIKAICTLWDRSGSSNCLVEEINSMVTCNAIAAMRVKLRQNLMEELQALSNGPAERL